MSDFITQEECLKRGGHHWNYYDSNDCIDKYGRTNGIGISYCTGFLDEYRKCALCGKHEIKIPAKWEEINNVSK